MKDLMNDEFWTVCLDDGCGIGCGKDMREICTQLWPLVASKPMIKAFTLKAEMAAKYGAPEYSLQPPTTPILPMSPL